MPFFPVPTGAESELRQFLLFIKDFGKKYSPSILEQRFKIFQENLKRIAQLNAENDDVEFGITEFADLTPEEFVQIRLLDLKGGPELSKTHPDLPTDDLPQSWDWREKGAVTAVRNQGSCGSCWAFSAVENIEGQHFIKTGQLVTLSPQQVVDCDAFDCNCHGGFPINAYKYVKTSGGLMPDDQYQYCVPPAGNCFVCAANSTCNSSVFHTYYCNEVCRFDPKSAVATISDALAVSSDEAQMAAALVNLGPLSACFNANHLMFYWRGILNPWVCDAKEFNHAVLVVGYGVERNKPYWTVKNSWGSRWGEAGYFRIIRGKGKCGINLMVTSAVA